MISIPISLNEIIGFLLNNNWVRKEDFPNKNVLVFLKKTEESGDSPITIVLPAEEDFPDSKQKIYSALDLLSAVEQKSLEKITEEIKTAYHDKLEIRIISEFAQDGSIPLGYASNLITGIRNLIVSAAYTEESPKRSFRRPSRQAISYGELFKLGQTNVGSYIVTVESTSLLHDFREMHISDDNIMREEPFSRRIMKRIHRSIHQIESLQDEEGEILKLVQQGYSNGLNANICEALLSMYSETDEVTIESKINYSRSFKIDEDLPNIIQLNSKYSSVIKSIAQAMREEENETKTVRGYVSKLSMSPNSNQGKISIEILNNKRRQLVTVFLEASLYKLACDAHKQERMVEITGLIDTTKKPWEVVELIEFGVFSS